MRRTLIATIFDGIRRRGCGKNNHCDECEFFRKHDDVYERMLLEKNYNHNNYPRGKRENALF